MLSIGEFARQGRVSHAAPLGRDRPAAPGARRPVDRSYDLAQLPRLHRAVALKDLGFTLEQVRGHAGAAAVGPPIAFYEDPPDGDGFVVHAAVPVAAGVSVDGCVMVDLPPIEAATIVHRGPMANIVPTVHSLTTWIGAHGYRSSGYSREVTHVYGAGDPDTWRTEVQEPVIAAADAG